MEPLLSGGISGWLSGFHDLIDDEMGILYSGIYGHACTFSVDTLPTSWALLNPQSGPVLSAWCALSWVY